MRLYLFCHAVPSDDELEPVTTDPTLAPCVALIDLAHAEFGNPQGSLDQRQLKTKNSPASRRHISHGILIASGLANVAKCVRPTLVFVATSSKHALGEFEFLLILEFSP